MSDLMGKAVGQPVYNLLGGRTHFKLRAYASSLYAMKNHDELAGIAAGYNCHNLHPVMASAKMPLAEYFPHPERDGDTFFSELFHGEPLVENGYITLGDKPGFGVELNEAVVARYAKR